MALLQRMDSPHKNIQFPQYRRYKNGQSYFKILSLMEFEEIKIIGAKALKHKVVAHQYPEKVVINDLLFNYSEFAEEIREDVYRTVDRMV
ncbi:MAG: hypothetical protein ACXVC6_14645 [Bacteroidia bacterium]